MNLFNQTKPASLTEWLETATDGLAAPSRERITREISAHYAAAVESHLSQGESDPVAKANALGELGDPKKSRRKFHRRHLTVADEYWGVGFWSRSHIEIALATNFILGVLLIMIAAGKDKALKYALILYVPIILGSVIAQTFAFWRLRQPGGKLKLSSMVLINRISFDNCILVQVVGSTSTILSIYWDVNHRFTTWDRLLSIFLLLIWILAVIETFQKWKKIRRLEIFASDKSGLA
jgi:hypothetical protein